MAAQVPAETRKTAGVVGIRCALALDDRPATLDFIRLLSRDFGHDPDVLYVIVHAYSDLSSHTALDLARFAPQSTAAHKLNAEALEDQGKWQPAELEYEEILRKDPNAPGIHFLLGRVLLSQPDGGPDALPAPKQEFLKELKSIPETRTQTTFSEYWRSEPRILMKRLPAFRRLQNSIRTLPKPTSVGASLCSVRKNMKRRSLLCGTLRA